MAATSTLSTAATYAATAHGGSPLPGLTLNPATGVFSGTPTTAGTYATTLTAANSYGTGASALTIQILAAGTGVTRELWTGLPGSNVSDIPQTATPNSTDNTLTVLEGNTTYIDNTSERLRGYPLTVPPLTRSGNVALPGSKFDMGNTNALTVQSPLDSPTVFNFFYPDYKYPGFLAANGVTTPEFQLTTDSNIMTLTNTEADATGRAPSCS